MSATLSYLHQLQTGVGGKNWKEVKVMLESYHVEDFAEKTKSLKPTIIPSLDNIREAFTKLYDAACGVPFALWATGLLAAWCWIFFGARANVDMDSLKKSTIHDHNCGQPWYSTALKGGRNKLSGRKKGTRPWNMFVVCLCPEGKHQPVPQNWEWSLDHLGNPRGAIPFCSVCPINCCELKARRKVNNTWKLFSKWTKTTQNWVSNHGDPAKLAIDWFGWQGYDGPRFDRNAGRHALARLLTAVHAPYHEGFQIHGDLYDVWKVYQPGLKESKYAVRTQSCDPFVATAALRRFQIMLKRGPRIQPPRQLDLQSRMMYKFLEAQGQVNLAVEAIEEDAQGQH